MLNKHSLILSMFCILLCTITRAPYAFQNTTSEELLDPAEAFKILVSFETPETLHIEYAIAEGYYLYRDRFRFTAKTNGYSLGTPEFSKGKMVDDDYFGQVETYHQRTEIKIPLLNTPDSPKPLALEITSQGCAGELAVCYQPYTHNITLPAPAL